MLAEIVEIARGGKRRPRTRCRRPLRVIRSRPLRPKAWCGAPSSTCTTAGRRWCVISGNHDYGAMFEALSPLAGAAGVHVLGRPKAARRGRGAASRPAGGEHIQLACMPFLSQRYVVRAAELMAQDAAQNAATYAERYRCRHGGLCAGFSTDTVNLVMAHVFVTGRSARRRGADARRCIEDYWVDASVFPPSAQYVALGHLHRTQQLPGGAPIWYSGSPIQVDFGEGGETEERPAGRHRSR